MSCTRRGHPSKTSGHWGGGGVNQCGRPWMGGRHKPDVHKRPEHTRNSFFVLKFVLDFTPVHVRPDCKSYHGEITMRKTCSWVLGFLSRVQHTLINSHRLVHQVPTFQHNLLITSFDCFERFGSTFRLYNYRIHT